MTTNFQMVVEFHRAMGLPVGGHITRLSPEREQLRRNLIEEEFLEWQASLPYMMADQAKELADLLYVVYGTAAEMGIDLDAVFEAVHESNMSKLDDNGKPIRREDGKILKGPNYKPPLIDLRRTKQ
jgi:predicted HAD superfamily Cof-like phosphohydrolase